MGLDNYWMKNKEELGTIEGEFKVWGGALSDNGNDSFRGKIYAGMVKEITGKNLYDEEISNDVCKDIASKLEAFDFYQITENNYDISEEEYNSFVQMFKLHSEAGHYLVSSW